MDDFHATIPHPGLRKLYEYWLRKRGSRSMPSRTDIDPAEIAALLPHITLIEVLETPLRFRYRLFGTGLTRDRGEDLTGRFLDEPGLYAHPEHMAEYLAEVVVTGRPSMMAGEELQQAGRSGVLHRLALPLSSDGERVDMILGISYRTLSV